MDAEATGKVIAGDATWAIEHGNVLDYLRSLPDGCVHCVVTSPPYWGLRSYLPDQVVMKEGLDEATEKKVIRELEKLGVYPIGDS